MLMPLCESAQNVAAFFGFFGVLLCETRTPFPSDIEAALKVLDLREKSAAEVYTVPYRDGGRRQQQILRAGPGPSLQPLCPCEGKGVLRNREHQEQEGLTYATVAYLTCAAVAHLT